MIFLSLLWSFFIIGAGAFGGGYSAITMIEHEIVSAHGWITAAELSELIAVAQMTPGVIGMNAATYAGFRVAGFGGAAAATAGFALPSLIICFTLIRLLNRFGSLPWVETLRKSVRPAAAGLIIAAVLTYGRAALIDTTSAVIAVTTFAVLALSREKVHPMILIICGGIVGVLIYR